MNLTNFIRTSQQNVINKNYGKQLCGVKILCRFEKQPYAAKARTLYILTQLYSTQMA